MTDSKDSEETGEATPEVARVVENGAASGRRGNDRGRGPGTSAKQLLLQDVSERALEANPILRAQLTGTVGIVLTSSGEKFLLDWVSDKPQIRAGGMDSPDCVIYLSEQNLLKIAQGDLNPQIGMLSDKIKVEGKLSFASYFFNLVVPR